MKIPGLRRASEFAHDLPDGLYLVEVRTAAYRRKLPKPYFAIEFVVIEPNTHTGKMLPARVYSTPRALWKLHWFLCDFGYDRALIDRDEVDERALVGMKGVVRLSQAFVDRNQYLNIDAFMPADKWLEVAKSDRQMSSPKLKRSSKGETVDWINNVAI
jgi:hypothetical protein